MDKRQAVADRIIQLCNVQGITPNAISYRAGVPQSTVKSILNNETKNGGIERGRGTGNPFPYATCVP